MIRLLLLAVFLPVAGALAQPVSPEGPTAFSTNEEVRLVASDGPAGSRFGSAVSLDGDRALVGAPGDGSEPGAAYVFVRSGGAWIEEARLSADDGAAADGFGGSVSLDGDRALIGAAGADNESGAAYVFVRSGGEWFEEAKLTASEGEEGDDFGYAVSLDADYALVGAPEQEPRGATHVFVRSGATWTAEAVLEPSLASGGAGFGYSVSLDGSNALVGAWRDDVISGGSLRGSAFVYTRSESTWSEEAKLVGSDVADFDLFGLSVSLDGDRALIGSSDSAQGEFGEEYSAGAAYVFLRSGTGWAQEQKLVASEREGVGLFGFSVSLDGDSALVGAFGSEAAYVFARSGATWVEETVLAASGGAQDRDFGFSVSLQGERVLVGARDEGTAAGAQAGAAYVYGPATVAGEDAPATRRLQLGAPFPNPARDQATVRYTLHAPGEARLTLFDVLGREVAVLAAGPKATGAHEARLSTARLPAGLYVLRLTVGPERVTRKVLVTE
jgi:hypothetical protein